MLCRAVFESAEKLEAVSAVREYENLQRADNPTESLGVLQDVVFDAGRACASQVCNCSFATSGLGAHLLPQTSVVPAACAEFSLCMAEWMHVLFGLFLQCMDSSTTCNCYANH